MLSLLGVLVESLVREYSTSHVSQPKKKKMKGEEKRKQVITVKDRMMVALGKRGL